MNQEIDIAKLLISIREAHGYTQERVSQDALQISHSQYGQYERGQASPTWDKIQKLARFYKISDAEFLLFGAVSAEPEPAKEPATEIATATAQAARIFIQSVTSIVTMNMENAEKRNDFITAVSAVQKLAEERKDVFTKSSAHQKTKK